MFSRDGSWLGTKGRGAPLSRRPRALPVAVSVLMLAVSLSPAASAALDAAPMPSAMAGLNAQLGGEGAGGSSTLAAGDGDETASSPLITDDVKDTAAAVLAGASNLDHAGTALVAAGDLNGDGRGDLAYTTRSPWEVHIVAGEGGAIPAAPARSFAGPAGDVFGVRLAGGGDLNGDGLDDLAVVAGTPQSDGSTVWRVELLLGASTPMLGNQWLTITAPSMDTTFAAAVAIVPDMDGDGIDDLLVSATPAAGSSAGGRAWVFAGGVAGPAQTPSWSYEGPAGLRFGAFAASAGDLNGDGYGDFVVTTGGAPAVDGYSDVYVFYGAPSMDLRPPTERTGEQMGDGFGTAVVAGDFNGDGHSDLAIAAPGFDLGPEITDAGKVYELRGTAVGLSAAAASTRTGSPGQRYAASLAAVGDINGDGYDDLVVGAPLASADGPFTNGQIFAYFGSSGGLPRDYDFTEAGGSGNDLFGAAAAGPGDVDGDGANELAVAAPGQDMGGHPDAGAIHVYDGKRLRLPEEALVVSLPDLTGGQALAMRPLPYHIVATVVYRGTLSELAGVEVRLICPGTGHAPVLSWSPSGEVTVSADDAGMVEVTPDTAVGESSVLRHGVQLVVGLRFDWSFDEPGEIDIDAWAADSAVESTRLNPSALRVNAQLEFSDPLVVRGQDGRIVAPGGFVRAGETLSWSGGGVVYSGTQVVPPPSAFYVRVGGGSAPPVRATVDPATGQIDARRAAPAEGGPGPSGYAEAVTADDVVLVRSEHPVAADGTPVAFGGTNPPGGSTLSVSHAGVAIPIFDGGSGVDPATVEWSVSTSDPPVFDVWHAASTEGSSPVVATAEVDLVEGAGNHIQFRASDRVGNGPATSPAITLSLDYGAVEFKLSSPEEGAWLQSGDVTLNFQVANPRGVDIDLSALEYMVSAPAPGQWTPVGLAGHAPWASFGLRLNLPDGAHNTVTLRAALTEGGSYWSRPFVVAVDATDPTIHVTDPAGAGWVTEHTALSRVFIEDPASGVATGSVYYRVLAPGATEWSPWHVPTVRVAPAGVYASATLEVSDGTDNFVEWSVQDNAGNGPTTSGYLRILVDSRPVTFGSEVPADGSKLEEVDRFSVEVRDLDGSGVDLSTVEFRLYLPDGRTTAWTSAGAEGIVSEATVVARYDLPVGTTVIEWRARDAAGTPEQVSHPVTVTVLPPPLENLPPRIVMRSPLADGQYLAGVDLKLDATPSFDPEGLAITFSWWIDGVAQEDASPVLWVSLPAGHHSITLVVTDGTAGSAVKTVEIDVVEPTTPPPALGSPLEQALIVGVATLALMAFAFRAWSDRARRALRR